MKNLLITIVVAVLMFIFTGVKASAQNVSDSLIVGYTGATTYSGIPEPGISPLVDQLIKVVVGIVSAIVSHWLILFVQKKSQTKS